MALIGPHTIIEVSIASAYIFVLVIIITSKSVVFKNAFFILFVATGIADVTSLLANVLLRMNRELRLGEEFQYVVLYLALASGISFVVHMLGNIFIAVNRYTSIRHSVIYEEIWTRKNLCTVIAVQYIVSIACSIYTVTSKLVYIHKEDGTTILKGFEAHVDVFIRCTYFGVCTIYAIVSVILNARTLTEWHRISKMTDISRNQKHEKRLLLYTLVVFIFTMLMCSQQFTRAISLITGNDQMYLWASGQFFWINDIMVSIPPISLIVLSSDLRRHIVDFFRKRRSVGRNVVVEAVFFTRTCNTTTNPINAGSRKPVSN
ncbi:hypothetical protein V3C99_006650 [Haemonchus contortus]|uniref:Serpentine receptor class gamma n=2 Tax=Haemonchus contortus TaxID=6289 RepID=A0A912MTM7_HAECO